MSGSGFPNRPLLPHYPAFEKFSGNNTNSLLRFVAIGMYVQAECLWAKSLGGHPTSNQLANFHHNGTLEHTLNEVQLKAEQELEKFGQDLIASHQKKFLDRIIGDATESVHKSKKAFFRGVAEAFFGAFAWTLALIIFSFILRYYGVDIVEVYQKMGNQGLTLQK